MPFAAIERWSVVTDDNGNSVTWLVINALKKNNSCHAHYIAGSYPDANAHARQAADDLAGDFNCDNDAPTVDFENRRARHQYGCLQGPWQRVGRRICGPR